MGNPWKSTIYFDDFPHRAPNLVGFSSHVEARAEPCWTHQLLFISKSPDPPQLLLSMAWRLTLGTSVTAGPPPTSPLGPGKMSTAELGSMPKIGFHTTKYGVAYIYIIYISNKQWKIMGYESGMICLVVSIHQKIWWWLMVSIRIIPRYRGEGNNMQNTSKHPYIQYPYVWMHETSAYSPWKMDENGPFIDGLPGFTYWKWWFAMAMLNNQMVYGQHWKTLNRTPSFH